MSTTHVEPEGTAVNHCIRHYEEPIAGICRTCQSPFCDRCLVFAFGPKKPPYCVGCAIHASGVRSPKKAVRAATATPAAVGDGPVAPPPATALARRTARAEKRSAKATARAARRGRTPEPRPVEVGDAPSDTFVPAPGQLAPHRYDPSALDQLV